ncbi:putative transcription factor TGA like domain-containing protein [Helianthus anomalus]
MSRNSNNSFTKKWFRSYERTFMWLAGFKPSLAIQVAKKCGLEFSSDQAKRLERLTMVAMPMLALARMGGKEVIGMVNQADTTVDSWWRIWKFWLNVRIT